MERDLVVEQYFTIGEWFFSGGMFMYYIVLVDVVVLFLIVAAFISCTSENKNKTLKLIGVVILIPLIVGIIGHYLGYEQTMRALMHVNPLEKEDMYQASMSVAIIPSIFGLISSFVLFCLALTGLRFCKLAK